MSDLAHYSSLLDLYVSRHDDMGYSVLEMRGITRRQEFIMQRFNR